MARFFVSYSRSDKAEVSKVVALLSASGHEVWWDSDIPVIDDWWRAILTHIEWCEVFIFVASEKSLQSDYCLAELKYANDRQRPILPFILEDPSTLHFPASLPHRNQWLIYDGDPARMLSAINAAYKNIEWHLHKNLDVPRPPEPSKGGKSLAQLFQSARRLANNQQFEEAKHLFQDIKKIDYEQWGTDCDEWLAKLVNYEQIVELVQDASTLEHAQQAWQKYVRSYGDDFDPYPVKLLVSKRHSPRNQRIAIALVGVAVIVVIALVALPILNNPNEVETTLTPTGIVTISAPEIAAANILPNEPSTPTLSPSDTSEATVTLTPTPSATPSQTMQLLVNRSATEFIFCPTWGDSSLFVGAEVFVGEGVNIRQFVPDGQVLGQGQGILYRVKIVGGPECANDLQWWQVMTESGITGWAAEGSTSDTQYKYILLCTQYTCNN